MTPSATLAAPPPSRPAPAGTVLPPNDVCEQLARRLRSHTQGEVLFDAASRGRYATDASIYQIDPVGVFVPKTPEDVATALALAASLASGAVLAAWEPSKPVEFVVPAGTGGGADQMARFLQGVVTKNNLMKQPIIVVNKSGGAGAEGFLDVKGDKGNPHKIVITLSNLFTTPLATGVPFNWRDLTPVQMLALDQFVLWVSAGSPHKTAKDLVGALRSAPPGTFKLGGTGSKQEDQLIGVLLETAAATRITYVPLKGGGDVARALAAGEVDMTVNNPIEAEALWRQGKLRPLCVFDGQRLAYLSFLFDRRIERIAWDPVGVYQQMLREISEQCRLADELGYDSVSFTEHHFHIEGFEVVGHVHRVG